MTIELTHVQAGLLRALVESRGDQGDSYELDYCLTSTLPPGVLHYDGALCVFVSAEGVAALAAYDAEWVSVERWRLEDVANYVSECTPLTNVSDEEIVADVVARAHCEIMLSGKDWYGEPTDGSKPIGETK